MSSPSNQIMGASLPLLWSCQVQLGVSTRSPGAMSQASPLIVVHTPLPSRTNRIAPGEWRCAGADSPALRYCTAPHSVGLANGLPSKPGFASDRTRRSPPRAIVINSPARWANGLRVSQRQSQGTAAGVGARGMRSMLCGQSGWSLLLARSV